MANIFSLTIEPEALVDIQNAIDYYNSCQSGLGKRFYKAIEVNFALLQKQYFSFAVRYDDVRCMKIKTFPYMIHYRVSELEKQVSVKAVLCTFDNPEKWSK